MLPLRGAGSAGAGARREAAGRERAAGTPARAGAGRGTLPSQVALITFVLVLREGETSAQPALGGGKAQAGTAWGWWGVGGAASGTGTGETPKGGCQPRLRSGSIVRDLMG